MSPVHAVYILQLYCSLLSRAADCDITYSQYHRTRARLFWKLYIVTPARRQDRNKHSGRPGTRVLVKLVSPGWLKIRRTRPGGNFHSYGISSALGIIRCASRQSQFTKLRRLGSR
ncbi:hypothetical protein F5Y15DRAFT_241307 [Xylariaceae sp. FL0016]|nr:hypothetical protein F5Y15DRAFT_241307 [Xylariaceae sp. FL0016]